jgi:hypothetical protein
VQRKGAGAMTSKTSDKTGLPLKWIVSASAHGCRIDGDWPYAQKHMVMKSLRKLVQEKGVEFCEERIQWGVQLREKPLRDQEADFQREWAAANPAPPQAELSDYSSSGASSPRRQKIAEERQRSIAKFREEQATKQDWIPLIKVAREIAEKKPCSSAEAEEKTTVVMTWMARRIAQGALSPPLLFVPRFRIRRLWLQFPERAPAEALASRDRIQNWIDIHGERAIGKNIISFCWVSRDVAAKLLRAPEEISSEFLSQAATQATTATEISPPPTHLRKPTRLTLEQALPVYDDRRRDLLPKKPTIEEDKAWVTSMNLPRNWVFELRKRCENNPWGRPAKSRSK